LNPDELLAVARLLAAADAATRCASPQGHFHSLLRRLSCRSLRGWGAFSGSRREVGLIAGFGFVQWSSVATTSDT
jgi:hypothetical protein